MRFIDADVMKTVEQIQKADFNSIETIRAWIDEQPTIEERKTGEWVLDEERSKECVEHIYICSACRNNEAWGETERTRYCSYCGAQMRNWT